MEQQQQPLLHHHRVSEEEEEEEAKSQHRRDGCHELYLERRPSLRLLSHEVTLDDVRSASSYPSSSYYPPSIHAALVAPQTFPDDHNSSSSHYLPHDQASAPQGGYGGLSSKNVLNNGRQILDEVEIRQLLIEHVGHRCCWGSSPARKWKIVAVEDCNVYVGTLETFIEEREAIVESEPYKGGKFDGKDNGPELGIWELDLTSEFPLLFVVPPKEIRMKIPHSEAVVKCSGCTGRGQIPCPTCNAGHEPGFYKANQMSQCSVCYGRGLIAHKDGSDTLCMMCNGKGVLPCVTCGSRGLVECHTCQGQGFLLTRNVASIKWTTLSTRKVAAASGAASVPDEVFHAAKGSELCNIQAYQCTPANFADSFLLNKFSSEIIADRPHIPLSARLICERHAISVVPVTRVTMAQKDQSFGFYIIGLEQEVYIKNYPARFCWGLCCCLEWLKV